MKMIGGDLVNFRQFVDDVPSAGSLRTFVKEKRLRSIPVTRIGETVSSFRGRLRRAFWKDLSDEDIVVELPDGTEMKIDDESLPASYITKTSVTSDGICNLVWIIKYSADVDELGNVTRRIRCRLQKSSSGKLVSDLTPYEMLLEVEEEEKRMTWDGKSGIILEISVQGMMSGRSEGGVYVKKHPDRSIRSVFLADGMRGICDLVPDVDLLTSTRVALPPTGLSVKVKYAGIKSEKNVVVSIQTGLELCWKSNRDERRAIGQYEVRVTWEKGEICVATSSAKYDALTDSSSCFVMIGLLHHDIPANTTLSVRLVPIVLNRYGQPSLPKIVRTQNALILKSKEDQDDEMFGVYYNQCQTRSTSSQDTKKYVKHTSLTGDYWTEVGDDSGFLHFVDPTRTQNGGVGSETIFVKRAKTCCFVVRKDPSGGTWNLFEGEKKILTCDQIEDNSFPLIGWNDDIVFTKGLSLLHAMGGAASESVVKKMLDANSNPLLMLSSSGKEEKEEEKQESSNMIIQSIIDRLNGNDQIRHSVSSLLNAVVKDLATLDNKELLREFKPKSQANSSKEEKRLEKYLTSQTSSKHSPTSFDLEDRTSNETMCFQEQRQNAIQTCRAKLLRLYATRIKDSTRRIKEENLEINGVLVSRTKLTQKIKNIARQNVDLPILTSIRRVAEEESDESETVFAETLKALKRTRRDSSSSVASSIVLCDALKREEKIIKALLNHDHIRVDFHVLNASCLSNDNDELCENLVHDLLFEGTDDTLRIRSNLSEDLANNVRQALGDSLYGINRSISRNHQSIANDSDVMKTLVMEYFEESQGSSESRTRRLVAAEVSHLSCLFAEHITGIQSSIPKSLDALISTGYENVKKLLEISFRWKSMRKLDALRVASLRDMEEHVSCKLRELERRYKIAKRELDNSSHTQFDDSRQAYYAQKVKIAEMEWRNALNSANSAREQRMKELFNGMKEDEVDEDQEEKMIVVLLYGSNGDVFMDSTLHVAVENGRLSFIKNVVKKTKDASALVRLLSLRRPAIESRGHTLVGVASSSGREWKDARVLRWFLEGCLDDIETRSEDIGQELANFGFPLDVARYQMEKNETLLDAMRELLQQENWFKVCLGLQLRMARAWRSCTSIAMRVSKIFQSSDGNAKRSLQILSLVLSKKFESSSKTKKWFMEDGRAAVRYLSKIRTDIAQISSQLIRLSSSSLSIFGISSISIGTRLAYVCGMLDLLGLLDDEKKKLNERVAKCKILEAFQRLLRNTEADVNSILDILPFVNSIKNVRPSFQNGVDYDLEMSVDMSSLIYLLCLVQYGQENISNEILRLGSMKRFRSACTMASTHGSLLHIAARRGATCAVASILSCDPQSIMDLDENGHTALHSLALGTVKRDGDNMDGVRDTARLLLDTGVYIYQRDSMNSETVFSVNMPLVLLKEVLSRAVQGECPPHVRTRRAIDLIRASEASGYAGRLEAATLLLFAAALIGRSSILNRPLQLQCRSVVVEASIRMLWKEIIMPSLEAGDLGVEALEVVFNRAVALDDDDDVDIVYPLRSLLHSRGTSTEMLQPLRDLLLSSGDSVGMYAEYGVILPFGAEYRLQVEEIGQNDDVRNYLLGPLLRDRTRIETISDLSSSGLESVEDNERIFGFPVFVMPRDDKDSISGDKIFVLAESESSLCLFDLSEISRQNVIRWKRQKDGTVCAIGRDGFLSKKPGVDVKKINNLEDLARTLCISSSAKPLHVKDLESYVSLFISFFFYFLSRIVLFSDASLHILITPHLYHLSYSLSTFSDTFQMHLSCSASLKSLQQWTRRY